MISTIGSVASQGGAYSAIPNSGISWVIVNEQAEEPRKIFNLSTSTEVHLRATTGTYGAVWMRVRSSIPFDFSKYTKLTLSCSNNGAVGTQSSSGIFSLGGYCDINGKAIGASFFGGGGGFSLTDTVVDITSFTEIAYIYFYLSLNSYQNVDFYATKLILSK